MIVLRSVGLFIAAGLAEIGGGYLVWRWLREGSPWPIGLAGAVILVIYGVIPTLQPAADNFGRVYAAYGGVFVIMSLCGDGNRRAPARQLRVARCRHRRNRRWSDLLQPTSRLTSV